MVSERAPGSQQPEGESASSSDIDALLRDAGRAAQEARESAAAEEMEVEKAEEEKLQAKQKATEEKVQNIEQMQEWYKDLDTEGALGNFYEYDLTFDAYEKIMGIAPPEGAKQKVADLRKIEDAYKELSDDSMPKTERVEEALGQLRAKAGELLVDIKETADRALEDMKVMYQGEKTEFARKHTELTDGPLLRGVEYDPHSPEAREKALKHEITELLMRPVVTERTAELEKKQIGKKARVGEMQQQYNQLNADQRSGQAEQLAREMYRKWIANTHYDSGNSRRGDVSVGSVLSIVRRILDNEGKGAREMESHITREKMALEVNKSIVDSVLDEAENEEELSSALIEMRSVLGEYRKKATDRYTGSGGITMPSFKNPLAQKIIGAYTQQGVELPKRYDSGLGSDIIELEPIKQIVCRNYQSSSRESNDYVTALYYEARKCYLAGKFAEGDIDTKEFLTHADYTARDRSGLSGFENEKYLLVLYKDIKSSLDKRKEELPEASKKDPQAEEKVKKYEVFIAKFPDEEAFITAVFAGEAKRINMQRAFNTIDEKLKEGDRASLAPIVQLSPRLKEAGWQETKQGAFAEDKKTARKVDYDYGKMIERLSAPLVEAKNFFDVTGESGRRVIYTTDQAAKVIGEVIEQAQGLIEKTEKKGEATGVELDDAKRTLENRERVLGRENEGLVKTNEELQDENEKLLGIAREAGIKIRSLEREKQNAEQRSKTIIDELRRAQQQKVTGMGKADKRLKFYDEVIEKHSKEPDKE